MSIHFAAASMNPVSACVSFRRAPMPLQAANDNGSRVGSARGGGSASGGGEQLLHAALRHFAQHGLCAAERARENAEAAFFDGRSDEYRWWMAICTALDRRMPAAVAYRRGAKPAR